MSVVKFEPLRSLARNAQRRHMEMQCDPSWVLDVFDERDTLRAEVVAYQMALTDERGRHTTAEMALRAEVEALRKDAERYRWLRENASVILEETVAFTAESGKLIYSTMPTQREVDAAIDAAMAAKDRVK